MFVGFLRQSSLAPPTTTTFDLTRHLTWDDVAETTAGLNIKLKWTKTIQRSADATSVLLAPIKGSPACPLAAFKRYAATRPTPTGHAPLLTYEDGKPVTTRYIARRWATLLNKVGHSTSIYSLHSLRKGGASFAYNDGGADLNDVMTQGTWRSLAVRDYIKPADGKANSVHCAFARL